MNPQHKILALATLAIAAISAVLFQKINSSSSFQQGNHKEITVSAAISLTDAMQDIQAAYTAIAPDTTLTYNFAASGTLQRQIEQGAPVDVFLSAGVKQMDALDDRGLLVRGTRRDLLQNRIVAIAPSGTEAIADFRDLQKPEIKRIAIGEPETVPAGQYARELLLNLDIFEQIKPKIIFARNVRQVLTLVETGNVEAGIVYQTDALHSPRVEVEAIAPEGLHSRIIYPVAAIENRPNLETARGFVDFLESDRAREIFKTYGFIPLTKSENRSEDSTNF
ncbi:molybdate ABC transporter substrate-binding protein [Oxynema aestuarii]|uniref:Molybdate ABC transporter substrate-binding protein n=1 Tax=Oxynema aestuarii AP17 TaxID=2064643 RepID=A0A6H1TTX2_9CYAN|nr:molybdate ABC transporter substrate-binding protein [Oxynema aestuarii]QIZ70042.1 molybdate ABC transporter substrate-binding protein [Oxynema aestuarii AP17]